MFLQHRVSLQNCFQMSQKLKSSLIRIFYPGKNVSLPCWTCIESLFHLQLLNPTQADFQKILTIRLMQIRYVVTPFSVFSNNLFDVYCFYKETKYIWDSFILKYTAEDVIRQRFMTKNCYHWEMIEDKDIKIQIIEYHKLLEDSKLETIMNSFLNCISENVCNLGRTTNNN